MQKNLRIRDLLVLLVAAAFVSTHDTTLTRGGADAGALASVSDAVADASARLAANARTGRHLGFDTYAYPGDAVMRAWRHEEVPYEWVGYYLPAAPCHKGTTWAGKRQTLEAMGWGTAVIYVGQQPWGDVSIPPGAKPATRQAAAPAKRGAPVKAAAVVKRPVKRSPVAASRTRAAPSKPAAPAPNACSRANVTAARGRADAADAIARTEAEGFARGSVVFLDIERMDRVPQAMRDYYRAWTAGVLADGRYRPGVYVHKFNAQVVYDDVKGEYVRAGARGEPPFWVAGGRAFSPEREPHEVGHAFAKVWQGVLDVAQEWQGYTLPIDVNVAHVPSPSSHEYATAE